MEAIHRKFGTAVETDLVVGVGGIFDVVIDDERVYRKWDTGRFPGHEEILEEIEERLQKE